MKNGVIEENIEKKKEMKASIWRESEWKKMAKMKERKKAKRRNGNGEET